MAKKKKSGPDIISLSELARRAGVTRQAVNSWILQQEKSGIVLAVPMGRRGKVIDANDKLVARYINNSTGKSNRAAQGGESAESKSPNTLRKLQFQAKKLDLQNKALREKYIPTESIFALLDKYLEAEKEACSGYSERVLRRIEKELKMTIDPERRKRAKQMLDNTVNDIHITTGRMIDDFKQKNKPKIFSREAS